MAKRQYNTWRELDNGTIEIALTQNKVTLIDKEDFEKVYPYKWIASFSGRHWYVSSATGWTKRGRKKIALHRLLLDAPKGMEVDHVDGNTLDNRRSNIRLATRAQNAINVSKYMGTSSKYKGVGKESRLRRWRAILKVKGKPIHLGYFDTEEEAAQAYNEAALEHFGEFARLNQIGITELDKTQLGSNP